MGLWQNNLTELFPELRKEMLMMKARQATVSAVSTVSFGQQKQVIDQLRDSIAWVPYAPGAGGGSIHYSRTINIER